MPELVSLKMVQITRVTNRNFVEFVEFSPGHMDLSPGSVGMWNFPRAQSACRIFTGFSNHFGFSPGWSEIRLLFTGVRNFYTFSTGALNGLDSTGSLRQKKIDMKTSYDVT